MDGRDRFSPSRTGSRSPDRGASARTRCHRCGGRSSGGCARLSLGRRRSACRRQARTRSGYVGRTQNPGGHGVRPGRDALCGSLREQQVLLPRRRGKSLSNGQDAVGSRRRSLRRPRSLRRRRLRLRPCACLRRSTRRTRSARGRPGQSDRELGFNSAAVAGNRQGPRRQRDALPRPG